MKLNLELKRYNKTWKSKLTNQLEIYAIQFDGEKCLKTKFKFFKKKVYLADKIKILFFILYFQKI